VQGTHARSKEWGRQRQRSASGERRRGEGGGEESDEEAIEAKCEKKRV
jgi:hypothetical protein